MQIDFERLVVHHKELMTPALTAALRELHPDMLTIDPVQLLTQFKLAVTRGNSDTRWLNVPRGGFRFSA